MTLVDVITATLVLASAGYLLVRSIRKSAGGGCHGCGGACHATPPDAPDVVELRRRRVK